jgi:L-lactate permease
MLYQVNKSEIINGKSMGFEEFLNRIFMVSNSFLSRGISGAFIASSNTVSNIMFSAFQYGTTKEAGLSVIPVLSLQALGGAAGKRF